MLSMFLPPFGMLIGKWVAIDAIISAPTMGSLLVIMLVLIGSAATTLYYAKWLGHMLVLPQAERKTEDERLPFPYSFSLYGLLALAIVLGAGVSMVIGALVLPAMPETYLTTYRGGLFDVTTSFGSFLTYPIWIGAMVIFLIGGYIAQKKGGVVKPPYLSGENISGNPEVFGTTADTQAPIELSNLFMDNEFSATRVLSYGVIAGAILVIIMFITVVL
jgi:ech hydrogenase subunit A